MAELLVDFEALSVCDKNVGKERILQQLVESETKEFLDDTNLMIIMRGVPGSGKTTIVKYLVEKFETNCVCSADNYFMRNGTYVYERSKIKHAHEYCQRKATEYCEQQQGLVIIDNTNVKRWETNYYVDLAKRTGYVVIMITPRAQDTATASVLAERNSHGVGKEIITQKLKDFDNIVPAYFGWFVTRKDALRLERMRADALSQLAAAGISPPRFEKTRSSLHMTSVFLGRMPVEKRNQISETLMERIGEVGKLSVTAVIITERTVSVRVKLSGVVKRLYSNDLREDEDLDNEKPEYVGFRGLLPNCQDIPKGHSAHITLGTATGIQARQGRFDAILACACTESKTNSQMLPSNITYFTEHKLAIAELPTPIPFRAMFAGGYR